MTKETKICFLMETLLSEYQQSPAASTVRRDLNGCCDELAHLCNEESSLYQLKPGFALLGAPLQKSFLQTEHVSSMEGGTEFILYILREYLGVYNLPFPLKTRMGFQLSVSLLPHRTVNVLFSK